MTELGKVIAVEMGARGLEMTGDSLDDCVFVSSATELNVSLTTHSVAS
jgi:hypothetical protein